MWSLKKIHSYGSVLITFLMTIHQTPTQENKIYNNIQYMCLYIYDRTIQSWTDDIDTYIYIRTFKQSPYLSEDIVSVVIFYRKKIFPNIMIDLNRLQTCELAIQYTKQWTYEKSGRQSKTPRTRTSPCWGLSVQFSTIMDFSSPMLTYLINSNYLFSVL